MRQTIAPICQNLQNAYDTMFYTTNEYFNTARSGLETSLTDISEPFRRHKLNLNDDKTEFIPLCKQSKSVIANWNISNEDNQIPLSSTVKYLGLFLNQNLNFSKK